MKQNNWRSNESSSSEEGYPSSLRSSRALVMWSSGSLEQLESHLPQATKEDLENEGMNSNWHYIISAELLQKLKLQTIWNHDSCVCFEHNCTLK